MTGDETMGPMILHIKPLHPLLPSTCLSGGMFLGPNCATGTGYLVFLMDGITDFSGNHAVPDTDYAAIKASLPSCAAISDATLHGICQLTGAHMLIAQGAGAEPGAACAVLQLHHRVDGRYARADLRHRRGADDHGAAPTRVHARPPWGWDLASATPTCMWACSTSRTTRARPRRSPSIGTRHRSRWIPPAPS